MCCLGAAGKTFLMHQVNPATYENEKEVFTKLAEFMPPPSEQ